MLRSRNHPTRDYLRSDRIIRRKRRRATLRIVVFLLLLALVAGGAITLTRVDALDIKNIVVQGNNEVSTDEVKNIAETYASSSWLYIFPQKNIIIYPTKDLENDLQSRYPRFSDVDVYRKGLTSIEIQVIERQPNALWCDENDSCFLVDKEGFIYAPFIGTITGETLDRQSSSTSAFVIFSGGIAATSTPIGTTINSSSTFSSMISLLQGMKGHGLTPERVNIRNKHEFSVHVNPGGDVIFSDIRPLSESLDNLIAALESAAFKGTSSPQNFDYIDTRFGNKIFFKMK